jgi:hypothetical protein
MRRTRGTINWLKGHAKKNDTGTSGVDAEIEDVTWFRQMAN